MRNRCPYTIPFHALGMKDLDQVGGKNASLGEMLGNLSKAGILVPVGFATTAEAFRQFLIQNKLDKEIYILLNTINVNDIKQLNAIGKQIRSLILAARFSSDFENAILLAYTNLIKKIGHDVSVAVRSSATAEDLPEASFAGQQETYLNVRTKEGVLSAIKQVYASLFNDRAIAYRIHHGFAHHDVAISVGIQQMVRSDLAVSGVMFTLDTESGFDQVVFITSSYGLGELLVQGVVNPDEFYVHKPTLRAGKAAIIRRTLGSKTVKMVYCNEKSNPAASPLENENKNQRLYETIKTDEVALDDRLLFSLGSEEIEELARQALIIEDHYGCPLDIEWAKDGINGKLYILQARPETVKSRASSPLLERFVLQKKGKVLTEGRSIGQKIGQGPAKIMYDINDMHHMERGDVLVTDMTDPDWEPIMKRASAIVTNRGGRTCHAAIIARELGIPAVVGCSNGTQVIEPGQPITVSCAEGDVGYVYQGLLPFEQRKLDVNNMPSLPLKIMLNVGNPERAFAFQSLPNAGVGLARLEFLISNTIGIHPKTLLDFDKLEDFQLKAWVAEKTKAYSSPVAYYVERLKEGIATIAAAFYPKPVIVRLSDFKSNEYANLAGGKYYEPQEENPMLGFRGASRYISDDFAACFALECQAIRLVREEMGFSNVELMIPFVRTVLEAKKVIEVLKQHGLERGKLGLRILMMCELPSNALLASEFLEHFDGFSIGSNDLTQLTLGLDRDSALLAPQFDERNEAVKALLHMAIATCKKAGKYVGICGQGPSDHQDFAYWLMKEGIDSVSLNPDSVLETCLFLDNPNFAHETIFDYSPPK